MSDDTNVGVRVFLETNFKSAVAPRCRLSGWGLILALFCLVEAARAEGAVCTPAPPGVTSWWPGDGDAGDLRGGHPGVLEGGATATDTGEVQTAFGFDGTNAYVQIPDAPDLRPTNFTIEAWVKFSSLDSAGSGGSPAGQQYIIFKQNTRTSNFEGFDFYKQRVGSSDYFVFGASSALGVVAEVRSTIQVAANTWYHLAGVRGSNYIQLYVNGQLQGQTAANFSQDYGNFPLYFGSTGQSYWDHKLKGWLDEVTLYNRPLASNEVAGIYAAGSAGKCKAVTLLSQPQSQGVAVGTDAVFSVTATGSLPLTYQWQLAGTNLPFATNADLLLTNVQPPDAGNYTVVVSDALPSSVTSAVAVLTVWLPPVITSQPLSSTNNLGGSVVFSATVTGSLPLTYRWQHDGVGVTNDLRISGADSATLQISNLVAADAGAYALVAGNAAGAATSSVAVLTLITPPVVLSAPASQEIVQGRSAYFSVTASGTQPLSYQWQRNGADLNDGPNLSGARTSALALANATTNDAGGYRVVITNSAGATTSAVAVLVVDVLPLITTQPVSQTLASGTNAVFTVTAYSPSPASYQWRFNGGDLADGGQFAGASSPALTIAYALPANNGGYSVVVSNLAGAVTSVVAMLTVDPPTDCLAPPPGLVGWWPGDGSARDLAGTNDGVLMGTATASAPGFNGQAFSFDGTNGYVQIPDSPDLRPTNLSVEVWVNFDAYQTPGNTYYSNQQYIVFKQNSKEFEFEGYALTKDHDPQGDVFLWEVASPTAELIRIDSVNTVVTGQWYHVVGVRGPDYVQLYMNGRLEVETNVDFPQDYGTNPLYFGTSGQSYYDRRMHGRLDEVALYNRALSANEIQALYQSGAAGKCKGTNGLMITEQPQSQTVPAGTNVLLSVGATGVAPITFQWQLNGLPLADATNATLLLTNVQPSQAGVYRAVLAGPGGLRTSADANLIVTDSPYRSLLAPHLSPQGRFSFTIGGVVGENCVVQYGTNLVDWTDLESISNATGLVDFVDPSPSTNQTRFYRVRWAY